MGLVPGRYPSMACFGELFVGGTTPARVESFWRRVDRTAGGCWIWTGVIDRHGYGRFVTSSRRSVGAHRAAYLMLVGPIPPGLELDHLCKVTACVNPDHLDVVTHDENLRRSNNHVAVRSASDVCINGHLFDVQTKSQRRCSICDNDRRRARRARARASAIAIDSSVVRRGAESVAIGAAAALRGSGAGGRSKTATKKAVDADTSTASETAAGGSRRQGAV